MSGSKIKILRAFRAGLAIYFAAILILDAADWIDLGHVVLWQLAALAFVASVIGFQTFVIRHQRWIDAIASRPRPDYPAIAAMERDIYGETFGHDGAPGAFVPPPVGPRLGIIPADAYLTVRYVKPPEPHWKCLICGYGPARNGGLCAPCYKQEREHRSNLRWERPS